MSLRVTATFAASLIATAVVATAAEPPVWFWHMSCGGPTMTLEVRFDSRLLYTTLIPLCHMGREAKPEERPSRTLEVPFVATRSIKWEGYRDEPDVTPTGRHFTLNLWQAGADPNDLIIGVSAADETMLYMNAVHIAHADRRDETEIADGLVVVTYPRTDRRKVTKP